MSGELLVFRRNAIIAGMYNLIIDDMEKCFLVVIRNCETANGCHAFGLGLEVDFDLEK